MKITHDKDIERGYILSFVRKQELSKRMEKHLPTLRQEIKRLYERKLDPRVRILHVEAPAKSGSEIRLPPD